MKALLHYQYRDGDNYKRGGVGVLDVHPPHGDMNYPPTDAEQLDARIKAVLSDEEHFIAHQVGVPEVFNWDPNANYDPDDDATFPPDLGPGKYVINDADHCWHEFDSFELVDDAEAALWVSRGAVVIPGTAEELITRFEQ